ncbi:MAG TPA: hypothetical protein DCS75_03630 [Gemmatimonadetes bacterium]|nr:hypothetical protein [Gemmatimonadota bacterium]HAT37557.1 hypothetical protein [Gemmatimonadota bacterium]HCO12844.1 hypothetical protein [Gemmatimonadota bacterium]|tara:strand:+ start:2874 stop:3692 length:819 start_codon:yes stop_codon:yes gene_type:complete
MEKRPIAERETLSRTWLESRGLGSSRLQIFAFGASVAAHALAILLYTSISAILQPDTFSLPIETDRPSEQRTPLIRLIDIIPEDLERPEDPEELAEIEAGEVNVQRLEIGGVLLGDLLPPPNNAADRLRPNLVDARLWAAPPPEFFELSLEQREELLLSNRIVAWYDSVSIARAAEDRLTDWTFTDSNGGRWGVADGKIYLGDVALPLPLSFGTPVGPGNIQALRVWEFEEIERQSQRYLIEQTWKERAEAIRARRDRERAAARADTSGVRW